MQFRFPKNNISYMCRIATILANVSSKISKVFLVWRYGILEFARTGEIRFLFQCIHSKIQHLRLDILIDGLRHFIFRISYISTCLKIFDMSFQTIFSICSCWVTARLAFGWDEYDDVQGSLSPMLFIASKNVNIAGYEHKYYENIWIFLHWNLVY